MTIYNKEKVFNLLVSEQVKLWHKLGSLSSDQLSSILASKFNRYSRSHIFYRIGVFALTTIILGSSMGLIGLITNVFEGNEGYKVFIFIAAVFHFVVLYIAIVQKGHFKSGADDALLYWGLVYIIAFIQVTFNKFNDDFFLVFVITALPFIAFSAYYFIDRTLSVLTFIGVLALLFLLSRSSHVVP